MSKTAMRACGMALECLCIIISMAHKNALSKTKKKMRCIVSLQTVVFVFDKASGIDNKRMSSKQSSRYNEYIGRCEIAIKQHISYSEGVNILI